MSGKNSRISPYTSKPSNRLDYREWLDHCRSLNLEPSEAYNLGLKTLKNGAVQPVGLCTWLAGATPRFEPTPLGVENAKWKWVEDRGGIAWWDNLPFLLKVLLIAPVLVLALLLNLTRFSVFCLTTKSFYNRVYYETRVFEYIRDALTPIDY